jgi:phosphoglycolate phosphatase-like HAD superfamily hydrolase
MAKDKGVLIVFDLVSTLTDAAPRYVQAFVEAAEAAGAPAPDRDLLASMLGNKNLGEITDHFIGKMDEAERKKFMGQCNQSCDALLTRPGWQEHLFPNVREAVQALHLQGATLGIYTGTREDAMELQLKYHDLSPEFDRRYIRGKDNERDAGKKTGDIKQDQLKSIVASYRADQGFDAPVIVIGDSAADAAAAAKEGLFFIGFAVNDKKKEEMQNASVKIVITDFGQLPDLVDRLMHPAVNDNLPRLSPSLTQKPKP